MLTVAIGRHKKNSPENSDMHYVSYCGKVINFVGYAEKTPL